MNNPTDYDVLNAVIAGNSAAMEAAECHGILSGMLCVNRRLELDEWLLGIFGSQNVAMVDDEREMFVMLFNKTSQDLEAFEFDFDLFLPDEDASLAERAEALSLWCKGYLYGLGSLAKGVVCSDDGKEVLRDIYQIADLQSQALSDDDEEAYMELVEYLRVGVQLLRIDFQVPVENKRLH